MPSFLPGALRFAHLAALRIPGLTGIEYFDGPHAIHGVGTMRFPHRHLDWSEPAGLAATAAVPRPAAARP